MTFETCQITVKHHERKDPSCYNDHRPPPRCVSAKGAVKSLWLSSGVSDIERIVVGHHGQDISFDDVHLI